MENLNNLIECTQCKHPYFAVTLEYAQEEMDRFNIFYNSLPEDKQKKYYPGPSTLDNYQCCLRCGNTQFQESSNLIRPGQTMNPIIYPVD